jgi:hypothetical protein
VTILDSNYYKEHGILYYSTIVLQYYNTGCCEHALGCSSTTFSSQLLTACRVFVCLHGALHIKTDPPETVAFCFGYPVSSRRQFLILCPINWLDEEGSIVLLLHEEKEIQAVT